MRYILQYIILNSQNIVLHDSLNILLLNEDLCIGQEKQA